MARYIVKIGEKEFDVDLKDSDQLSRVNVNGREYNIESHRLNQSRTLLLVDKNSFEVDIHPNGNSSKIVFMLGQEFEAKVEEYQLAKLRKRAGMTCSEQGEAVLKAAMPGLIVNVVVKPGDSFEKGSPLVVIEAMKMENVIKARSAGCIKSVLVEVGEAVEKGQKLLEFE